MFTWLVTRKTAQWVKVLLCKYKDFSGHQNLSKAGFGSKCLSSWYICGGKRSRARDTLRSSYQLAWSIQQQAPKRHDFQQWQWWGLVSEGICWPLHALSNTHIPVCMSPHKHTWIHLVESEPLEKFPRHHWAPTLPSELLGSHLPFLAEAWETSLKQNNSRAHAWAWPSHNLISVLRLVNMWFMNCHGTS